MLYWHKGTNTDRDRGLLQRMRQKRIVLGLYLDQAMVDHIYRAMDIPVERDSGGGGIDESIDDDI